MKELQQIASHFAIEGRFLMGEPYGCGHINSTYCLYYDRGSRPPMRVILQKINTGIFRDPDGLMNNIALVTEHIRNKNSGSPDADCCTLTVIPTVDGKGYYRD